jgi:hypothetical protein
MGVVALFRRFPNNPVFTGAAESISADSTTSTAPVKIGYLFILEAFYEVYKFFDKTCIWQ